MNEQITYVRVCRLCDVRKMPQWVRLVDGLLWVRPAKVYSDSKATRVTVGSSLAWTVRLSRGKSVVDHRIEFGCHQQDVPSKQHSRGGGWLVG